MTSTALRLFDHPHQQETMNSSIFESDLALPDSANDLLQEALTELQADQRTDTKRIIKQRLTEIARLEFLLAKARKDLAELLKKDPEEIRMLGGGL